MTKPLHAYHFLRNAAAHKRATSLPAGRNMQRATLCVAHPREEEPVMAGPGNEIPNGRGHLRGSRADRERVIDVLKAAFVEGRLTKDEFELRVGRVLKSRAYADFDAVTSDLPATSRPPAPAPEPVSDTRKLTARRSAGVWGVSVAATEAVTLLHDPVLGLIAGALIGCLAAVLVAGFLTFLEWV